MKGEYEFHTLVVCLLVLGLQIHNPFQPKSVCQCGDGASGKSPSGDALLGQSSSAVARSPQAPPQAPPVYRRPQAPDPPGGASNGLSTDELLRELDSIQGKAREQQDTLTAAGRMPPASPILQQIKEAEGAARPGSRPAALGSTGPQAGPQAQPRAVGAAPPQPPQPPPRPLAPARAQPLAVPPALPSAGVAAGAAQLPIMLKRREDFGRFLQSRQPQGLGVVLGVGRGDFALRLLLDWSSAQGVYLVDPYIHIWRGYDDPANLGDREHQLVFEELRNRLVPFEGRHVLVRDFSHSFAESYGRSSPTPGPPTFVYIDANPAEDAISQDLDAWWPLLAPGGILAGGSHVDSGNSRVQTVVGRFAARQGLQVYLTHDDSPPSWFCFKP